MLVFRRLHENPGVVRLGQELVELAEDALDAAARRETPFTGRAPKVRHRRIEKRGDLLPAKDERPPLLRAYLEKWKWEVGAFFGGVGPDSSEEELRRIAPDHPAFRID